MTNQINIEQHHEIAKQFTKQANEIQSLIIKLAKLDEKTKVEKYTKRIDKVVTELREIRDKIRDDIECKIMKNDFPYAKIFYELTE